jgi:hypothetical protein
VAELQREEPEPLTEGEEHVCNSSQESKDGHQILPQCDQQAPVACKSCPCDYTLINRKLLKIKHSEKPSPFTEVNNTISLKDLQMLFLKYEFKLGHRIAKASRTLILSLEKALLVKGYR